LGPVLPNVIFPCLFRQSWHWYAFLFSSRRRHTSSKRDWSSDVCSSDLRSTFAHPAGVRQLSFKETILPVINTNINNNYTMNVCEIGRASCRERELIWAFADVLKSK